MALPWKKTDDTGAFRFEHLPLGRYIVFAEDKEQGYSMFSTGVGGDHPPEVELTTEHPKTEFNLHLPPKGGFLLFHLTNQKTGAAISGVEVTVNFPGTPPKFVFSGGQSSSQPILVPSNQNLLLHVKSWGFREWDKTVGDGRPIRIAPGDRLTLDVQLEPSNPLSERIPDPEQKQYLAIRDANDWKNPCLTVRADGIEIAGAAGSGSPIAVESIPAALERLPDEAWPYGLIVVVQKNGVGATEADQSRVEKNRNSLVGLLRELGVRVDSWPSAGPCEQPIEAND
jgi:hypothetical protein